MSFSGAYVLRVPATLPATAAPSPSSVGPPPTPVVDPPPTPAVDPPPTPAVDPPPTPAVDPTPTLAVHHSPTPVVHPCPTFVIITPTPSPMLITPTPSPDPTSIPSSSSIPSSETVTPSADPDSVGDGEGVDLPLHDQPWIEPYGKWCSGNLNMKHIYKKFPHESIPSAVREVYGCPQCSGAPLLSFPISVPKPRGTELLKRVAPCILVGRSRFMSIPFTHVRKGTNEFVDERSRKTHVRFEHGSAPTLDDASNAEDDIRRTQC
ncbi:pollen-specific leucine-rich repeat extensin-like protein 1 [Vigna umbellata]|uniref:pollen-specific leucine-rich repeat extensin-like protein 1 n=1 Tax=Vigna umbellata TaxID=87088 RepID=UPI001F5F4684|nr:pollen-specific leucine-rich repeat extensin-like protein 1 [Vigna umbellata]